MAKEKFPVFGIHDQRAATMGKDVLTIDRFGKYLSGNPHLHGPHKHSFYHLVCFTKGKGSQLIDFVKVPVRPGVIYFMNPSQVHQWLFEGAVDGYIVNFSPTYFEQVLSGSQLIQQFGFFQGPIADQVLSLSRPVLQKVSELFEAMLLEQSRGKPGAAMMIASLLVQLFVTVQRAAGAKNQSTVTNSRHQAIFRNFTKLLDQHYRELRLPKEYSALLFVTPHQLNVITQEIAGISSGELIRDRVILEAKRLLVNFNLSIGEIAAELNFRDSSYFVRFFRKSTGQTPDSFRNLHYSTQAFSGFPL